MKRLLSLTLFLLVAALWLHCSKTNESSPAAEKTRFRSLIIDADTGNEIDDLYAIVRALVEPSFEIKAVCSAHYHTQKGAPENTVRISQDVNEKILQLMDQRDIPHPLGANAPLPDTATPRPSDAAQTIIHTAHSMKNAEKLNIAVFGPMTNVASAILMDSTIIDKIRVHIMGLLYDAYNTFWQESKGSACSWFYYPASLKPVRKDGIWFFNAHQTFLAVIPLTPHSRAISPKPALVEHLDRQPARFFNDYHLLVFPGQISGYIVETGERADYKSMENFVNAIRTKTELHTSQLTSNLTLSYRSLTGDTMIMSYRPEGLRCDATINGETQDWDSFTNGAVYDSPFLNVRHGRMEINNGKIGYAVEFIKGKPVWTRLNSIEDESN